MTPIFEKIEYRKDVVISTGLHHCRHTRAGAGANNNCHGFAGTVPQPEPVHVPDSGFQFVAARYLQGWSQPLSPGSSSGHANFPSPT